LDIVAYADGRYRSTAVDGGKFTAESFAARHSELLQREEWIIDGYGTLALTWERLVAADTLVYVDLPVASHYWGVTKRFCSGLLGTPKGWPDGSPLWSSTLKSFRVVGQCDRKLTPKYREFVAEAVARKSVHHLKSRSDMDKFIAGITAGVGR
jgi:hypothetical protein